MSIHEEVELLKGVPLFSKLEPTKLKLLAFTSERLTFAPGQDLCRQGDMGDAMYVVLGGTADIIIETPSGPHKVAELRKNGFVGEIAILCDVPRTATVTVRETLTDRLSPDGIVSTTAGVAARAPKRGSGWVVST